MLEDICHILNTGEVPELFTNEEKAKAVEEMESNNNASGNTRGAKEIKETKDKDNEN